MRLLSWEILDELGAMQNKSLLDSLDRTGLKLDKGKAPLEVISVDDVKKTPTEN